MLNKEIIKKILSCATEKNPYAKYFWIFDDETLSSWAEYIVNCKEFKNLERTMEIKTVKEVLDNFKVFFFSDEIDGEYIPIRKQDLKMYMIELAKMFGVSYEKEFKSI